MQDHRNPFSHCSSAPESIFSRTYETIPSFCSSSRLLCVDRGVPPQVVERLRATFNGHLTYEYLLPGGEACKTREAKQEIEDWALSMKIGGDTTVIGVGGGAILDLVAFFAATYARGLPLIFVPSTLLSMADAAFGGKCGVNAKGIKNIVGTIYHPKAIFINVELLQSLPINHMLSGLAEVAKHALLDSKQSVDELFSSWDACLNRDSPCLEKVIARSLAVKKKFCAESKEFRHFLNAGHTVAHALEGLEGPQVSHGVAVAIGLYVESMVGLRRGVVGQEVVDITRELVSRIVPEAPLVGGWNLGMWKQTLALDKKNVLGQPHVAWIHRIGYPYTCQGNTTISLEWTEVEYAYDLVQAFWKTVPGLVVCSSCQ